MSRFSRSDRVDGVFEYIDSSVNYSGYNNNNYWCVAGDAGYVHDPADTFRFWRENGKVYSEGDIRAHIFPEAHICLGRFPEGFRPKISVYIGKACGIHTADIQIRVDPSGYMSLWANPKNPAWYSLDNNSSDAQAESHPEVTGWVGYLNKTTWQDGVERTSSYHYVTSPYLDATLNQGTTTSPMDLVGFRCNSCWDVGY